ncbi:phospholipase A-2-activating protein [Dothidotthia symphoricarpi CBS 119687]|uniref:Phospholipase A-2-activating protein n=1 Tax=Dothidotthia symphoricarpi CBS 119687 TaxID=1392245 RepID=A0A6A6ASU5_9PLEO|nr:phospholipase A-2-activating protein [Dothidotthia symphoricarpi CBS 119687]KAF2135029.1 phospholipase A-2-activating protein [Dothidotthia symphoricarpi CBS 119687]
MGDFKLSATLRGHEDNVRSVAFPAPATLISGARDHTVRLWTQQSSSPPTYDSTIKTHGQGFVNAVTLVQPSSAYPEGLIVSSGHDQIIDVRPPSKSLEDNAEALLVGHGHNVCTLDVSQDGRHIVSGSWDREARIWEVGKWGSSTVLQGHDAAVWAVLAYDNNTIITGCADKQIRFFGPSGKLLRSIHAPDIVRALCRLPPNHPSGAQFASAGNDAVIRLWTIDGKQVAELYGHENFIYSLAVLPNGGLVSGGEDRTLRVWENNQCIQTITHPALSVWTVAVCPENGDIASGTSDNLIRIFTRDKTRYAAPEAIEQFLDDVKGSSIPQQAMGDINKEKLPGPDFLTQRSGTKEGQVQMILEANGNVSAYTWSGAANEWINVGTVVDSAGSGGRKVSHKGKEYDYVFDVDIEDGKPPLKLPYNLNNNHYEAARKFIEDNELPLSYLDQVANFIVQNTQGATLGQSSAPGADPWGTDSRYRPGDANQVTSQQQPTPAPPATRLLPQKDYLPIATGNHKVIFKKLQEFNQALVNDGQKGISLNPSDLEQLSTTVTAIEKGNGKDVDVTGVDLLVKAATQWPADKRLPALDLVRLVLVFEEPAAYLVSPEQNLLSALAESDVFASSSPPNNTMMAIRCLSNLLQTDKGRLLASTEFDQIHPFVSPFITSTNRNLIIALTTLYINYSVLLISESNADRALSLLDDLSRILTTATDSEAVYRALVATGTLLCLGPDFCEAGRDILQLGDAINRAEEKVKEPRVTTVIAEIREKLHG